MFGLPFHLIKVNRAAPINVVHFEGPRQFLLGGPVRGDVEGEHELAEVDRAAAVGVERAEDVLAELGRVAAGEHPAVHGYELLLGQLPRRTVFQESSMPGLHKCRY